MLPDFERAGRIGEFWGYPESRAFAELLNDCEEDRTLRAVLVGMPGMIDSKTNLRLTDYLGSRNASPGASSAKSARGACSPTTCTSTCGGGYYPIPTLPDRRRGALRASRRGAPYTGEVLPVVTQCRLRLMTGGVAAAAEGPGGRRGRSRGQTTSATRPGSRRWVSKGPSRVRRRARRAGGRVAVPALFEKVTDRGSTDEDLGKITGGKVREAERRSSQAS
jgi:hypothetical protein